MRTHYIYTRQSSTGYVAVLTGSDENDATDSFMGISPEHAFAGLREQLVRLEPSVFHGDDRYVHSPD